MSNNRNKYILIIVGNEREMMEYPERRTSQFQSSILEGATIIQSLFADVSFHKKCIQSGTIEVPAFLASLCSQTNPGLTSAPRLPNAGTRIG